MLPPLRRCGPGQARRGPSASTSARTRPGSLPPPPPFYPSFFTRSQTYSTRAHTHLNVAHTHARTHPHPHPHAHARARKYGRWHTHNVPPVHWTGVACTPQASLRLSSVARITPAPTTRICGCRGTRVWSFLRSIKRLIRTDHARARSGAEHIGPAGTAGAYRACRHGGRQAAPRRTMRRYGYTSSRRIQLCSDTEPRRRPPGYYALGGLLTIDLVKL